MSLTEDNLHNGIDFVKSQSFLELAEGCQIWIIFILFNIQKYIRTVNKIEVAEEKLIKCTHKNNIIYKI